MQFIKDGNTLVFKINGETVRIEPWGKNSLRVRSTMLRDFTGCDWALTEKTAECAADVKLYEAEYHGDGWGKCMRQQASITNGRLRAEVNFAGVISFYRDDALILREYFRFYGGTISNESRCLKLLNREWKGIIGGTGFGLNVKFESNEGEKIFGMGQYQQPYMDLKGSVLELAQRNSQISVPFMISSLGYGMLWNNPAVGRVTFGRNYTEWIAKSTKQMDYWITADEDPKAILRNYTDVTGHAPVFPESLMGLWQCKLRYR
ncbi:MAG: family 31 glucosidase, partial [Lachnospiraceae bacterium]|nr:family 31 glucosidase [Lachnospiraceae bacterium]